MRIIVTSHFPRSQKCSYFCQIVNDVNIELGNICSLYQILFSKSNDDWLQANGKLNHQLFWKYLFKTGYQKFATSLLNFISSCTHLNQHHLILEKSRSHFLPCLKPTSTFQPRRTSISLKNKSFVSLSLFINQLYNVYMFEKFLYLYLLLLFVLLVFPFLFQPILVNRF